MNEFNPNCGKCGMLNSRGFCSLTACRYPSNAIVVEPKVIRGMMVNPQIEKPQTNYDRLVSKTPEELAEIMVSDCPPNYPHGECREYEKNDGNLDCSKCWLDWLKSPVEVEE